MQKSYTGWMPVRYEAVDVPEGLYACHCKKCQKQLGTAFDMTLLVKESSLKVSGKLKKFERIFDSDNRRTA
jgi:hypothetical protein